MSPSAPVAARWLLKCQWTSCRRRQSHDSHPLLHHKLKSCSSRCGTDMSLLPSLSPACLQTALAKTHTSRLPSLSPVRGHRRTCMPGTGWGRESALRRLNSHIEHALLANVQRELPALVQHQQIPRHGRRAPGPPCSSTAAGLPGSRHRRYRCHGGQLEGRVHLDNATLRCRKQPQDAALSIVQMFCIYTKGLTASSNITSTCSWVEEIRSAVTVAFPALKMHRRVQSSAFSARQADVGSPPAHQEVLD